MTFRKLMKLTHLYLGVPVALIVSWVALSGALMTFQTDIRKYLLYPAPRVEVPQQMPQATALLTPHQLRARLCQQVAIPGENVPAAASQTSKVSKEQTAVGIHGVEYRSADEAALLTTGNRRSPEGETYYFVNPYTGELLAQYNTANDIFRQIMIGHRFLWLPREVGRPIVGTATLLFVVLIVSGLVMWLPKKIKKATIKQAFSLSTKGGRAMVVKRWHGALGVYVAIVGLVVALTGLTWSFQWYRSVYNAAWGITSTRLNPAQSDTTLTAAQSDSLLLGVLFAQLQNEIPIGQAGQTTFSFAKQATDSYQVSYKYSRYSISQQDTRYFDRYTLRPLSASFYADKPLHERIGTARYDLHTGGAFGLVGLVVYFLASLAIASLPLTGLWIVINRQRKKAQKRK